ncbi:MAG: twin-arginine translocase TatA/TatE family subunit [Candidatus Kapabacteria bacterium]|nr:twin-arginine translocase TatA/TatE family subunit [Candidatus Kapabacteria bacterium]
MFDVGGGELLFIVLIILLLFGPKKIPELMRSIGSGLRHFRRAQEDLTRQIRDLSTQDPTLPAPDRASNDVSDIGSIDDGPDASIGLMPDVAAKEPADEAAEPTISPSPAPGAQPRNRPNDTPKESPQV